MGQHSSQNGIASLVWAYFEIIPYGNGPLAILTGIPFPLWLISKDKEVKTCMTCGYTSSTWGPVSGCPQCARNLVAQQAQMNTPQTYPYITYQPGSAATTWGMISSPIQATQAASNPPFKGTIEPRSEPLVGWRGYSLGPDATLSGVRAAWEGKRFRAECTEGDTLARAQTLKLLLNDDELCVQWRKKNPHTGHSQAEAHLTTGSCTCGIWGKAQLTEVDNYSIIARCQAYGVVAADKDGNWRASEVEMDSLYIVKDIQQRIPNLQTVAAGAPITWLAYVDYQRIADLLRDRYAVPVEIVESRADIPPL